MMNETINKMSENYSGSSLLELCKGQKSGTFYIPPIEPSKYHAVLIELPIDNSSNKPPKCYVDRNPKHWNDEYVRMPYSPKNFFPVKDSDGSVILKSRWKIICKAYSKLIDNVSELENAIKSYNCSLPKLSNLEYLFEHELSEDERAEFFHNLLPKITNLALRLPEILPGSIPLLKKNYNKSISMSQLQIGSLLANAFLCTFPWRKDVSGFYPGVNFVGLYSTDHRPDKRDSLLGKLKCIIHYFRRITSSEPKGVVTFQRISLKRNQLPRWDSLENNLSDTKVHISSVGTIEDTEVGFLQVDFANKNIGGGVLGYGCVQEEIRFVICPELIMSRLFVEQLCDTEAVIIRGVERFSKYTGYSDTFKWDGNYIDPTPFDRFKRRQTTISVIDAKLFYETESQYHPNAMLRELGKAYAGFYSHHEGNLAPVATGNWGCGAFNGDPQVKTLIQLMACSAAKRNLVYYTFGNKELQNSFHSLYLYFETANLKICDLWRFICEFAAKKLSFKHFSSFLQQCCFDKQNNLKKIESVVEVKPTASNSFVDEKHGDNEVEDNASSPENEVISSSQPCNEFRIRKPKSKFNKELFEKHHNEIIDIFKRFDETSSTVSKKRFAEENELISESPKLDKMKKNLDKDDSKDEMEISEIVGDSPVI